MKKTNGEITENLKRYGFDKSFYDRSSGYHRVKCSQCQAMVINGVATHEHGCPNNHRRIVEYDEEYDED